MHNSRFLQRGIAVGIRKQAPFFSDTGNCRRQGASCQAEMRLVYFCLAQIVQRIEPRFSVTEERILEPRFISSCTNQNVLLIRSAVSLISATHFYFYAYCIKKKSPHAGKKKSNQETFSELSPKPSKMKTQACDLKFRCKQQTYYTFLEL